MKNFLISIKKDKEKKQKEREILDKIDNDRYLEELKQEQKDRDDKLKQIEDL